MKQRLSSTMGSIQPRRLLHLLPGLPVTVNSPSSTQAVRTVSISMPLTNGTGSAAVQEGHLPLVLSRWFNGTLEASLRLIQAFSTSLIQLFLSALAVVLSLTQTVEQIHVLSIQSLTLTLSSGSMGK